MGRCIAYKIKRVNFRVSWKAMEVNSFREEILKKFSNHVARFRRSAFPLSLASRYFFMSLFTNNVNEKDAFTISLC